jgi:hypothetical protein
MRMDTDAIKEWRRESEKKISLLKKNDGTLLMRTMPLGIAQDVPNPHFVVFLTISARMPGRAYVSFS